MPAAPTTVTVKKADGTTDIVWTTIAASGGDTSPWTVRSETATGYVGQRPSFSMSSRWNGPKTARRVDVNAAFPMVYTDSVTSTTKTLGQVVFSGSFVVPQGVSDVTLSEAAAQLTNLLASSTSKAAISSGYAPT